jgi:rfaE bifunctional protein nucleotidyltransferase chain/domain
MSPAPALPPAGDGASYRRKIVSLPALCAALASLRGTATREGRRPLVVQCHGCFDIVHPGHIRYLQFARSQGDVLVVSITGDAVIDKGDQRPYIPQELRAENLAALEFVDYVIIDPHPTARELLESVRPDIYVKGQEYATSSDPRFLAEREAVESAGGRVIFSSGQVVFSSSRLLEMLNRSPGLERQRLAAVCARHGIDARRLSAVLSRIRGLRLLLLGDVLLERYVLCDANQLTTESPMMALRELDSRDYLGGAAFIALQAAALGARPILVTSLPAGDHADRARAMLQDAGVELRTAADRPDLPCRTRFLVDDHKLFKVDRGAVHPLDSLGEGRASALLSGAAREADAAIVYDVGYGAVSPGLLHRLSAGLLDGVPVMNAAADAARADLDALAHFDLLCCSERRLRAAGNDPAGLSTLAYQIMHRTQAGRMVVTLGRRGLVTFERPTLDRRSPAWGERLRSEYLPTLAAKVVDHLGADQVMLTIITLAQAAGAGLMQACYLASAATALRIARVGLSPVPSDDLSAWLADRPELEPAGQETFPPAADIRSPSRTDHEIPCA